MRFLLRLCRLRDGRARANSLIDCFDYNQQPIQFKPITSELGKSYFLHEKPSLRPPDDDF